MADIHIYTEAVYFDQASVDQQVTDQQVEAQPVAEAPKAAPTGRKAANRIMKYLRQAKELAIAEGFIELIDRISDARKEAGYLRRDF